jgi:hypothetical protein
LINQSLEKDYTERFHIIINSYPKEKMLTVDHAWSALTNNAPPIVHELRNVCAPRWVRFHSLPESKRYAESEAEYKEILTRHNTIIASFAVRDDSLHLLTANYDESPDPRRCYPELINLDPTAKPWRSIPVEDGWYFHVFSSSLRWSPGCLDPILRLVADDHVREVVLLGADGTWAYHPYDGGGDLICPNVETRDRLAYNYKGWLSQHPQGL